MVLSLCECVVQSSYFDYECVCVYVCVCLNTDGENSRFD